VAPPPQDDGGGSPSIAGNFYHINTGRNISIAVTVSPLAAQCLENGTSFF